MEKLCRKQDDHLENVQKAFANYKKSPKSRITRSYIESRLESLEKIWNEFNKVHSSIVENVSKETKKTMEYFQVDVYDNFEEAYTEYNVNEVMKRLFAQKAIVGESSTQIKHLLDNTTACLKALNNLGTDTKSWDTIVNYLVLSKLDPETRKAWELDTNKQDVETLPTWNDLVSFLETRFRTLEMLEECKPASNKQTSKKNAFHCKVEDKKEEKGNNNKVICVMCTNKHLLHQCEQFQKQSIEKRVEFIQSNSLCFNCFASNHSVKSCHRSTCCRKCGRRHHTLLHFERTPNQGPSQTESTKSENPVTGTTSTKNESERKIVSLFAKENQNEVLLATSLIKIKSPNGYARVVRALIDQGSEASFVTEDTVQSLGLKKIPVNGLVSGVGDGEMKIKTMVLFNLESIHNPKFSAYVLHTLTSFLPTSKISIKDWLEIEELPLADPKYGAPGRIDIILGYSYKFMQSAQTKLPSNSWQTVAHFKGLVEIHSYLFKYSREIPTHLVTKLEHFNKLEGKQAQSRMLPWHIEDTRHPTYRSDSTQAKPRAYEVNPVNPQVDAKC
ncbi:Uncharacterized protein OBRU01_13875 [Operophtera brumata]|uniref:Uncharacterized protein n=1 Tax=Operophtera brumata TaxID=104452 RepID=A0A0L7L744_OPEBR|nr:Uncharacterized protein OBRU01_13875 [Operophtera brumata]